ncbi:AAA domain-containing protein [Baffinella frigidus]|nr:AAA domain-containing protein [Cryptophyta sp. CCMP2293]
MEEALAVERAVIFIDTGAVSVRAKTAEGGAEGGRKGGEGCSKNSGEALVVGLVVDALRTCGVGNEAIGVISPYRAQVKEISGSLDACGHSDVEVSTVDKYQGRDMECVILSLVRCNASGEVGELLADWRRINVAITRAKSKLLLIGCATTLRSDPLLARMVAKVSALRGFVTLEAHDLIEGAPAWAAPLAKELHQKAENGRMAAH